METEQQYAINVTEQNGKSVLMLSGTQDVTLAAQFHQTACQLAGISRRLLPEATQVAPCCNLGTTR